MRRVYLYVATAAMTIPLLGSDGCVADQVLDTVFFSFRIVDVWL